MEYDALVKKFGNNKFYNTKREKVFCIGRNKTGTTSLKVAMNEFGYQVGDQREAEKLHKEWAKRDFSGIINYCNSADFFQDIPFSLPYTYVILDHFFPKSKFILTLRDSAEEWYSSLTRFHSKLWGKNGKELPTKSDLQNATYIYKGWAWDGYRFNYNTPEDDLYKKDEMIEHYNTHNKNVIEYFRHRSEDLLILNLSEYNSIEKLKDFLGVNSELTEIPWENKT